MFGHLYKTTWNAEKLKKKDFLQTTKHFFTNSSALSSLYAKPYKKNNNSSLRLIILNGQKLVALCGSLETLNSSL